jgi:hypothetical protein
MADVLKLHSRISQEDVEAIKDLWIWLGVPDTITGMSRMAMKRSLVESIFNGKKEEEKENLGNGEKISVDSNN